MLKFLILPQSVRLCAAKNAFLCVARWGANQRYGHSRPLSSKLCCWRAYCSALLFFCLSFALYGCGGATIRTGTTDSVRTLSIDAASVGFGSVPLNSVATQSVNLTSTGTASVTINSATPIGAGFTLSAATLPVTLNPGQALTLEIQFDPATTGAAIGKLTIASNSSTSATTVIGLSGLGAAHEVELSWSAPGSPDDPIAGYNLYRASSGSSSFQLLNSLDNTQTAYVDSPVQSGQGYSYFVTSVDNSGTESVPSDMISVAIP
jgi:hypothetical protein